MLDGGDLIVILCVALGLAVVGALVVWIVRVLRATDPDRAVAKAYVFPSTPFELQFTTVSPERHQVWVRFWVIHTGMWHNYGFTNQLEFRVGAASPYKLEIRVGDQAPALGPDGVRSRGLTRASRSAGNASGTAELALLPAAPPGTPVSISGMVTLAGTTASKYIQVFVMPP